MIRLIASDMDGTLLNEKMTISDYNIQAIRHAQQRGIYFMVATGRGHDEAVPALREAGLNIPMICLNGAQIYNEEGILTYEVGLEREIVKQIRSVLDEEDIYYEIITNNGIHSISYLRRIESTTSLLYETNSDTSYKMAVVLATARLEVTQINYVDSFDELLADNNERVLKILVHSSHGPDYLNQIKEKIDYPDLNITSSFRNNLEINAFNAQKGTAIEKFASQRNIEMFQVMALGDNYNDVSMLEKAGISVAVDNAVDDLKSLADYIAPKNHEDGVGKSIHALLKNHL